MKKLLLICRLIFTTYAFILLISYLLLIFPLVIVASFFGKERGGNFIYRLCYLWVDIELPLVGIFHKNIFESPHAANQPYVFVFNHISYMDIPTLMKTFRQQQFRVLAKADLAKIPLFGFLYKSATVMVDRSNADNRAKSLTQLKSIIAKGISVVIAPEGTFNMTHQPLKEFYNGAFKLAIETQIPIKPVLFLDNYDRLPYQNIFSLTPGKSRAVFLEAVPVDGLTLNDVEMLKAKVFGMMEQKLIAYKASWIKEEKGNLLLQA